MLTRIILKKMEDVIEGKETIHLVITDPSGNSAIISDKAEREELK